MTRFKHNFNTVVYKKTQTNSLILTTLISPQFNKTLCSWLSSADQPSIHTIRFICKSSCYTLDFVIAVCSLWFGLFICYFVQLLYECMSIFFLHSLSIQIMIRFSCCYLFKLVNTHVQMCFSFSFFFRLFFQHTYLFGNGLMLVNM